MSSGLRVDGAGSTEINSMNPSLAIVIAALLLILMPFFMVFISTGGGIIGLPGEDSAVCGDGDPYQNAWHFWWVSRALASGQDPRFCPLVYAPEGASLAYEHVGWFDTLLLGITGMGDSLPVTAHNLSLLMGTLLIAVFGWLLARSLGADCFGSIFTAMALAWLPSRTAHLLQHYQLAGCWALPAALWSASKFFSEGGWRWTVLFGVFSIAGGLESPFITVFAVICLPGLWFIIRGNTKRAGILMVALATTSALTAGFLITSPGQSGGLAPDWREAIYWAAEPQSFLMPSPFGTMGRLAGLSAKSSWMPNVAEGVVTPGLVVLLLFTFYVFRKRNWRLALLTVVLCLLALGPELRLLGRPTGVPLPFRLFQLLPGLSGIRAPSRFAIPAGIFMALGAGLMVSSMRGVARRAVFSLMLLELAIPSLPVLSASIPAECRGISGSATVLELPVDTGVRRYSWFQTGAGYSRTYSFLARLPEQDDQETILRAAVDQDNVIVYHRWLFSIEEREEYDEELSYLFPGSTSDDSVWIAGGDR